MMVLRGLFGFTMSKALLEIYLLTKIEKDFPIVNTHFTHCI